MVALLKRSSGIENEPAKSIHVPERKWEVNTSSGQQRPQHHYPRLAAKPTAASATKDNQHGLIVPAFEEEAPGPTLQLIVWSSLLLQFVFPVTE